VPSRQATVLVTGGLGYIGSHTSVVLAGAGYRPAIVDNLSNSKASVLARIRSLAGNADIAFHQADVRDRAAIEKILAEERIDAVLHFAGLKAVGESVEKPLLYYENNVGGTIALLSAIASKGVRRMVFSSSATVYGEPERLPLTEEHPLRPVNPYAKNKLIVEHILADHAAADPAFRYAALRYFHPIGAHPSGRIGEDPSGIPNNLVPYVAQVAVGRRPSLRVWGKDYPTPDGTGVRDYIHVEDLADAHLKALDYLRGGGDSVTLNCGYGNGFSVREVLAMVEKISGRKLNTIQAARRAGDPPVLVAHAKRVRSTLGWSPHHDDLAEIVRSAYAWEQKLMVEPWK